MRYKLDNAGYICAVSFGCYLDNCTEYTGAVPIGYNNLDEWASYACIQAYYLDENGNLTLDSTRKTELENKQAQEAIDNEPLVRKDLYETNEVLDSQYARKRVIGKVITLEDIKTISPIGIITGIQAYECKKIRLLTQGKNMLNCTAKTIIFSGVGFGVNPDGSLTVTGKATEDIEYIIAENDYLFSLKANEKYYLNLGGFNCELRYSNNGEIAQQYIGSSGLITVPKHIEVSQVVLKIPSGQSVNTTFHPQLEHGGSFTSYESYKCKVTEIDLSSYLVDTLCPEETLYPSDTLFPRHSTTINYIQIKGGTIFASIDGVPTIIKSGSLGLFANYSTIYADKDVMLEIEYSDNLLDVESMEFLQGKATTTNQFKILKDGSIEAHNGYFSGKVEADSGYFKGEINVNNRFVVDSKGNVTLPDNAKISWQQVTGANENVTQITKNTVTTEYINALNIVAGSVNAENIIGDTISGKQFESNLVSSMIDNDLSGLYYTTINGDVISSWAYNSSVIIRNGTIELTDSNVTKIKPGTVEIGLGSKTTITDDAIEFSGAGTNSIESSDLRLGCMSFGKIGFFDSIGATQQSVSEITSPSYADAKSCANKINEVISALKSYGLLRGW